MPDVEVTVKTGIAEDELAKIIGEYDGLIIRSGTKVTAKVLTSPGGFKAIATGKAGTRVEGDSFWIDSDNNKNF